MRIDPSMPRPAEAAATSSAVEPASPPEGAESLGSFFEPQREPPARHLIGLLPIDGQSDQLTVARGAEVKAVPFKVGFGGVVRPIEPTERPPAESGLDTAQSMAQAAETLHRWNEEMAPILARKAQAQTVAARHQAASDLEHQKYEAETSNRQHPLPVRRRGPDSA